MADVATAGMAAAWPPTIEAERSRRQALRIGFAVATGMTLLVATGSPLPFLAPLFAAQFLVGSRQPQPPRQAIGMAVLIIAVGQALAWTVTLLGDRPMVLVPVLWLLYFACFLAQAKAVRGEAAFLVLVIGIIVPLMELLHQDLGISLIQFLVIAVLGGSLLAWLSHVLFPDRGGMQPVPPRPVAPAASVLHRAVASASILVAVVVLCLVDSRLASATVLPITVASILGQLDLATSRRTAFGLVIVNIMGGLVASLVFTIVSLRTSLLGLFLVVFLVGLGFGAKAAADPKTGKVYAGALTIFLILLGLGVSPLPGSTPESFSTRIAYVSAGVVYALWAAVLLWPRHPTPVNEMRKPSQ